MSNIIKVKPNKDGRLVANLYGKDHDVTELAGKDGKGEFKAFGQTYQFEVETKSKSRRKAAQAAPDPEEVPENPES